MLNSEGPPRRDKGEDSRENGCVVSLYNNFAMKYRPEGPSRLGLHPRFRILSLLRSLLSLLQLRSGLHLPLPLPPPIPAFRPLDSDLFLKTALLASSIFCTLLFALLVAFSESAHGCLQNRAVRSMELLKIRGLNLGVDFRLERRREIYRRTETYHRGELCLLPICCAHKTWIFLLRIVFRRHVGIVPFM